MDVDEDTQEQLRHYWYLYLEIPKKNGKSELAAALGIYHLFADGELNAEVYICAADKENAGIVFNAAVFMLTTAPWTAKMIARDELHIVDSRKLIEYRKRVATANGGSKWVVLGTMSEQEIKEAGTGTHVFLTVSIHPVDAIEDVSVEITL